MITNNWNWEEKLLEPFLFVFYVPLFGNFLLTEYNKFEFTFLFTEFSSFKFNLFWFFFVNPGAESYWAMSAAVYEREGSCGDLIGSGKNRARFHITWYYIVLFGSVNLILFVSDLPYYYSSLGFFFSFLFLSFWHSLLLASR